MMKLKNDLKNKFDKKCSYVIAIKQHNIAIVRCVEIDHSIG